MEGRVRRIVEELYLRGIVWGDEYPCNVATDIALDVWVIDFGGMNDSVSVDDAYAETAQTDWLGIEKISRHWLPSRGGQAST